MRTVYLAGPILHCTDAEASDWRRMVCNNLAPSHITGISPLRCEPIIGERYEIQYSDPKFGTARAIGSKNIFDVRTCDMTLAYLPRYQGTWDTMNPLDQSDENVMERLAWHQSYGTIAELAWAHMAGKPTILVSNDPEVYNHPVLSACAGWVLPTLDDAIDVVIGVLGGYVPGGKNV